MPWFLGNTHVWNGSMNWHGAFGSSFFILPVILWSLAATGLALWHAAKRGEVWWFVFFLFVHTAGIVELLYLLFVVRIQDTQAHVSKKTSRSSRRGR